MDGVNLLGRTAKYTKDSSETISGTDRVRISIQVVRLVNFYGEMGKFKKDYIASNSKNIDAVT